MSFDNLCNISGLILIISIILIGYSLEKITSGNNKKGMGILVCSVLFFCISLKIFCSIDNDRYVSSNNSYSIKMCHMNTDDNGDIIVKDKYNISSDGFDSDIKIWSYNTAKVKEEYSKNNKKEHYYDYMKVSSKEDKLTFNALKRLIFSKCSLEDFVSQDVSLISNTGIIELNGKMKVVKKDNKTYYLINGHILCNEDEDNKISKLTDNSNVKLKVYYDKAYANGKEFFKYKI